MNMQTWSLLLGVVLPPVAAIVMQPRWSHAVRAIFSSVICLLVGLGQVLVQDNGNLHVLGAHGVVAAALVVFVAAQAAYRGVWQHLTVTGKIEAATSPSTGTTSA